MTDSTPPLPPPVVFFERILDYVVAGTPPGTVTVRIYQRCLAVLRQIPTLNPVSLDAQDGDRERGVEPTLRRAPKNSFFRKAAATSQYCAIGVGMNSSTKSTSENRATPLRTGLSSPGSVGG